MIRDIIKNPLCTQVVANCHKSDWNWWNYLYKTLKCNMAFSDAICWMFDWASSPQGDEYWRMYNEEGVIPQGLCDWGT